MYKKTFYGYRKESIEEAKAKLESNFQCDMSETDKAIEEALHEQKLLLHKLNSMIVDVKKSRESGWQIKQLKEYMPYIISQKKLTIQKETVKTIQESEQYIAEINKHISVIDQEIEKVRQRLQIFINSVSQLLVLRNVKEYDDMIRHFDQLLETYLPDKDSNTPVSKDQMEIDELYIEGLSLERDNLDDTKIPDEPLFGHLDVQIDEQIDEDIFVHMEEVKSEALPLVTEDEIEIQEISIQEVAIQEVAATSIEEKKTKKEDQSLKEEQAFDHEKMITGESTILFAEHDKEMAELLKHLFEREGFKVVYAADGREAYDTISSMKRPQVVLLNMMVPYLDGYQLINHIRNIKEWRHVPIVAITSNQAEWDTVNILNAGANDVIRKPYSPREILARIRRLTIANEKVI